MRLLLAEVSGIIEYADKEHSTLTELLGTIKGGTRLSEFCKFLNLAVKSMKGKE